MGTVLRCLVRCYVFSMFVFCFLMNYARKGFEKSHYDVIIINNV